MTRALRPVKDRDDPELDVPWALVTLMAPSPCSFDWKRIWKHHEYVTVLGLALLVCGIHLYDELGREQHSFLSQRGLIVVIVIISVILILERLFVSNLKKKFSEGLANIFSKKNRQSVDQNKR